MFWSKIRKIGIPCKPQFFYIKVGFKGVNIARTCFRDEGQSLMFHYFDMIAVLFHLLKSGMLGDSVTEM